MSLLQIFQNTPIVVGPSQDFLVAYNKFLNNLKIGFPSLAAQITNLEKQSKALSYTPIYLISIFINSMKPYEQDLLQEAFSDAFIHRYWHTLEPFKEVNIQPYWNDDMPTQNKVALWKHMQILYKKGNNILKENPQLATFVDILASTSKKYLGNMIPAEDGSQKEPDHMGMAIELLQKCKEANINLMNLEQLKTFGTQLGINPQLFAILNGFLSSMLPTLVGGQNAGQVNSLLADSFGLSKMQM
jgi:hypothetical protein